MNQLCRFIKESRKCFKITFGGFEHFTTNGDEIKNIYNVIMEEYIITIEQLEIYHRNILDKNSEDCNTGFAKQNLVLNGDFVPTNYVGLHKILQSPQQLTTENINDVHCSLEYHIKELLQDLFIVIT